MSTAISIPLCDPEGHFVSQAGLSLAMVNPTAMAMTEPSRAALFSLLQFGALVPPLSPWAGTVRLLPGYNYLADGETTSAWREVLTEAKISQGEIKNKLQATLDDVLMREASRVELPVVLFSGGVDSGLIATRLAKLGFRETLLLNFCFGDSDQESALAETMARHLRLRFERVRLQTKACECLQRPGEEFRLPFGDHSTVPTYSLVKNTIERLRGVSCVVFDGTGADDGFGVASKTVQWERLAKMPEFARKFSSCCYRKSGLWRHPGVMERYLKLFTRLNCMPLLAAMVAQNALAGLLYADDENKIVHQMLSDWITGLGVGGLQQNAIAVNMGLIAANIFAQKTYSLFHKAGVSVAYPFMAPEISDIALEFGSTQIGYEKKALLKALLSTAVPREMVYRPKSGFVDIEARVFYDTEFLEMLWCATEESSVLAGMVFPAPTRKVIDLLNKGRRLPVQLLNCIWAMVFTDRWYRTV